MHLLCFKVYKEDLPQLKQQSKEKNHPVPFLKREKAPEDSLKLQFIHGQVACHQPQHQAKDVPLLCAFPPQAGSSLQFAFTCDYYFNHQSASSFLSWCSVAITMCVSTFFYTLYTSMMHILLQLNVILLYSLHHLWFLCSHNSCSILLGSKQDNVFFKKHMAKSFSSLGITYNLPNFKLISKNFQQNFLSMVVRNIISSVL